MDEARRELLGKYEVPPPAPPPTSDELMKLKQEAYIALAQWDIADQLNSVIDLVLPKQELKEDLINFAQFVTNNVNLLVQNDGAFSEVIILAARQYFNLN